MDSTTEASTPGKEKKELQEDDEDFTLERSSVPVLTDKTMDDLVQWLKEKGIAITKPQLVSMLQSEEERSKTGMESKQKVYYSRGKFPNSIIISLQCKNY